MTIRVEVPMVLPSASNLREHWAARQRRVKAQRAATLLALKVAHRDSRAVRASPELPSVVTLTRVYGGRGTRAFDDDNLRGAFKAVRDEVAAYFGVNDNDPRIEWRYAQAKGKAMVLIDFEVRS